MNVENKLKSYKVIGFMIVLVIWDLRTSLRDVLSDLREATPDENKANVLQSRACSCRLLQDFHSCWGGGSKVVTYKKGPQRQPQGFRQEKVIMTALEPRCKMLYSVRNTEHDGV